MHLAGKHVGRRKAARAPSWCTRNVDGRPSAVAERSIRVEGGATRHELLIITAAWDIPLQEEATRDVRSLKDTTACRRDSLLSRIG